MNKRFLFAFLFIVSFCFVSLAQERIPAATLVRIVRAEDERRFDRDLQDLMKSPRALIRVRAALAAGRIGDEKSIPDLTALLEKDADAQVRSMAVFALGETESATAAEVILKVLANEKEISEVRARAIEAAGKIAAANAKDEKSHALGAAILDALDAERLKTNRNRDIVLLGLTAALRTRPEEADIVVAKFLTDKDERIRADAENALARLRTKNPNIAAQLRAILLSDDSPIARANAARALGAAEDKSALNLLIEAATIDDDLRVRVSSIRALGSLKDKAAAAPLLARGAKLFDIYQAAGQKRSNIAQKNELLEIATALGRLLPNSNDEKAIGFLENLRVLDDYRSPETEIAFAQIAPKTYVNSAVFKAPKDSGFGMGFYNAAGAVYYINKYAEGLGNFAQALGEIANNKTVDAETLEKARENIKLLTVGIPAAIVLSNPEAQLKLNGASNKEIPAEYQSKLKEEVQKFETLKKNLLNNFPDVLRALAKLKPQNYEQEIAEFLLNKQVVIGTTKDGKKFAALIEESERQSKERQFYLLNKDAIVRATAAELMGEITEVNSAAALAAAFDYAVNEDKEMNDAELAILNVIVKQKSESAKNILSKALQSPDYLVRRQAAQLIKENDLTKEFPDAEAKIGTVKQYDPAAKTKLGQILNSEADYVRAVSRKNGQARAVVTTEKGVFTIEFFPEDAPLAVDNFIKLANAKYFNNLTVHRVVPNFVMQDGDPRGDGNGSPGWQIRCEINEIPYERGAVGMALSGKDTGGSQWFVTHSPQPHLEGGYTVFGRVNETGMKIVDNIVRGDRILEVRIEEGISRNGARIQQKTR